MSTKEPLLNLREVAVIMNMSYNTLRNRIDEDKELRGRIIKTGPDARSWRMRQKDLDAYQNSKIEKEEVKWPSTKEATAGKLTLGSAENDLDELLAAARQRHKQKNSRLN
ncbi:MAG: hypothetical protein K0R66_1735 [Gammaproteobacteria bacterium]|jgi:hypothetical protein|nr:hypothetical protein [Gammaproteobacteria bacterium]